MNDLNKYVNNISFEDMEDNFYKVSSENEIVEFEYTNDFECYHISQKLDNQCIVYESKKENYLSQVLFNGLFLDMMHFGFDHTFMLCYHDFYTGKNIVLDGTLKEIAEQLEPLAECYDVQAGVIFNAVRKFKYMLLDKGVFKLNTYCVY